MEIETERELISEAMRVLGSRRSQRKALTSAANGLAARSEEARAKMRLAQAARRERERQEKLSHTP